MCSPRPTRWSCPTGAGSRSRTHAANSGGSLVSRTYAPASPITSSATARFSPHPAEHLHRCAIPQRGEPGTESLLVKPAVETVGDAAEAAAEPAAAFFDVRDQSTTSPEASRRLTGFSLMPADPGALDARGPQS